MKIRAVSKFTQTQGARN